MPARSKASPTPTYEVTGDQSVLGYALGDTFTADLSPDQETRLIEAGSIKLVTAPADDTKKTEE